MNQNLTTQAVVEHSRKTHVTHDEWVAIRQKYKRYEDAFEHMLKNIRGDGTVVVTKELLEALLSFDPLSE
jgi:hypothetical protein